MKQAATALVLACGVAIPAVAQTTKDAPAEPPQRAATERPALDLRLDNPASWATVAPQRRKDPREVLPTLGADARPIVPERPTPGSASSTYPADTNPGR